MSALQILANNQNITIKSADKSGAIVIINTHKYIGEINFLTKPRLGCFLCLACVNCKLMKKGESFKHPGTGISYKIRHFLTCKATFIVYVLWCPWGLIYDGETKNYLKTRLNQHHYSIRKGRKDLPVPKHFLEAGHSECEISFMIVDHIPKHRRGGGGGGVTVYLSI